MAEMAKRKRKDRPRKRGGKRRSKAAKGQGTKTINIICWATPEKP